MPLARTAPSNKERLEILAAQLLPKCVMGIFLSLITTLISGIVPNLARHRLFCSLSARNATEKVAAFNAITVANYIVVHNG